MNKDFERCCSFLADMIIKYAPEIKEEVEVCMMTVVLLWRFIL